MALMNTFVLLHLMLVEVAARRVTVERVASSDIEKASAMSAATLAAALKTKRFVDLTHAFHPGTGEWTTAGAIPHFGAFPDSTRERMFTTHESVYPFVKGSKGGGFFAEVFCHVGQWGTHVDPPVHFVPGGRKLDQILPDEMVAPLVVIDMSAKANDDHDAELTVADIYAHEEAHGYIAKGSFVALRTDYHKMFETGKIYKETSDGVKHYPNWSHSALRFLYEERNVLATGHEQTDTDAGQCAGGGGDASKCQEWDLRRSTVDGILSKSNLTAADLGGDWVYGFANEFYVLSRDTYQIELLANLDQLPPTGAMVVASFPKPLHGSGFPARVFAISDH